MLIAVFFAAPIGIFSSVYIAEFCSGRLRNYLKPIIELMAGIPTVVYGYFAAVILAPVIKNICDHFGINSSLENAFTAGIVMGLMIIPYITSLCLDVFKEIPKNLREASVAMGANQSETVLSVILPTALPGLVAIILLAVSRAIGETMIVTMAAGLTANLTINPFQSVTTITAQIVTVLSGDQQFDSPQTLSAYALALTLFIITFLFNIVSNNIMTQFEAKIQ
jgi:phosphate transport system permease protein